jgi:hypothetical protein
MMTLGFGGAVPATGLGVRPRTVKGEQKLAIPATQASIRNLRFEPRLRRGETVADLPPPTGSGGVSRRTAEAVTGAFLTGSRP